MKPILTLLVFSLVLFGCIKKPNTNDIVGPLAGTWQEVESTPSFAGTTYRIVFDDKGYFKLKVAHYTDAIIPGDPCNNYVSYMAGQYEALPRTITLYGEYYDSTFTVRKPDQCSHDTAFYEAHSYYFDNGNLVFKSYQNANDRIVMQRQ